MALSESHRIYYWNKKSKKAAYTTCYRFFQVFSKNWAVMIFFCLVGLTLFCYLNHATSTYLSLPNFSTKSSDHGWCGTCYQDALDPGQEGYCDKYKSGMELRTNSEMGRPKVDKNWGWCRATCLERTPSLANVLQETKLDILSQSECKVLGSEMGANVTMELCGGKKNYFPKVWKFKRVHSRRSNRYFFKPIGSSYNYLGFGKTKYNFYLGGTDSCQGTKYLVFSLTV